jgi:hypothetical protein
MLRAGGVARDWTNELKIMQLRSSSSNMILELDCKQKDIYILQPRLLLPSPRAP